MDANMRREIILEHYQNPEHRGLVDCKDYEKIRTNNTSCIDDLTIQIKVKDGHIEDIRFDGEACAISTSATSIMIASFIGKTKEEATKILENYEAMLDERPYDASVLGELNVYEDIYRQPNRKKCALLPFRAIHQVLEESRWD